VSRTSNEGTVRVAWQIMSTTPEFQAVLDAVSRAADEMTYRCNEYQMAKAAANDAPETPELEALRKSCDAARDAHDEAYADAWELIEDLSG
jgi:hypothetical protein